MYSKGHFIISLFASYIYIQMFDVAGTIPVLLFVILLGGVIGVVIDLDHFLISYWKTGDAKVKKVIKKPSLLWNQSEIFSDEDVTENDRLVAHSFWTIIAYMSIPLTGSLGLFTAWIWIFHIASDLLRDGGKV